MILIDSREPKRIEEILKSKNVNVKREFIEVADYLLDYGYAIERKDNDLMNSIKNNRIFDQLYNIKEYDNPILMINTENLWKLFYECATRYAHKQYIGFLTTLTKSFPDIRVIPYSGEDMLIDIIISLDKKLSGDEKSSPRPAPLMRKAKSIEDRKENALCAIQSISVGKAKKLLECYGSIKNLSNESKENLEKTPGIGKKLASNIYDVLH